MSKKLNGVDTREFYKSSISHAVVETSEFPECLVIILWTTFRKEHMSLLITSNLINDYSITNIDHHTNATLQRGDAQLITL